MQINVAETREIPVLTTGIDLTQPATSRTRVIDPTSSTVTMGFVASADGGQVPPVTFYTAHWLANPAAPAYYATILVGPLGVVQLVPGTWVPWVKFTLGTEEIIQAANDTLVVVA